MPDSNFSLDTELDLDIKPVQEETPKQKPLGQRLLDAGLITEVQLDLALREKKRKGMYLGEVLIDLGFVSPEVLTNSLASENKTDVVDVVHTNIDLDALKLISYEDAKNYKLIPLELNGSSLTVALSDAFNIVAIDYIERKTKKTVNVVSAPEKDILEALERNYSQGMSINETIDILLEKGITSVDDEIEVGSPMVRLADQIIAMGIKQNATDIHIEPDEKIIRVRYRVDGVLRQDVLIPAELRSALCARIKLMADMNISERRVPQDGRIRFLYGSSQVDLRVSTLPTNHGESVVMRILDSGKVNLTLDSMGFSPTDKKTFSDMMEQPYGMVLVTGPTGSGKTTTLYTALGMIDKEKRSVFTLEDPIEYSVSMIRQTPIHPEVGMDFAAGLKALLRQDPDVILIGEIRDLETSEMAIRAALTGHLMLSTLHTNTAAGVIPRLIDMGIEPYLLPAALNSIIGQRLVRKLCPHCKEPIQITDEMTDMYGLDDVAIDNAQFYRATGCDLCNDTGFSGRLAIYEILQVEDNMHDAILHGAAVAEIEQIACQNGMKTMRQDGLLKAAQGVTSIDEVVRVVR